jgi:mono/diheme cytochrome c family protein
MNGISDYTEEYVFRFSPWAVRLIVLILVAIGAGLAFAYYLADQRLEETYSVPDSNVVVATDPDSIEHGKHLVQSLAGCQDCHGEDLSGQLFFDDPLSGTIASKNLTSGRGGLGAVYEVDDWVRAIRHGIDRYGKPLIGIPSNIYANISDSDLGAIIGYLKTLPPVDKVHPEDKVGLLTRVFILLDPSILPAQVIDHATTVVEGPEPGISTEYGEYLAIACTICHGEDFSGGAGAGGGLNLTGGGDLANWTESEFMETIRTGITPTGIHLDPTLMPWERVRTLTDDELKAIWLYLNSLPARASNK